jgi:hypothetical protein
MGLYTFLLPTRNLPRQACAVLPLGLALRRRSLFFSFFEAFLNPAPFPHIKSARDGADHS